MKKLLSLATILTLSLALVLPVSAAEIPEPTVDEVDQLIKDAYDLYMNIYGYYKGDDIIEIEIVDDKWVLNSTAATRRESADYSYWAEKSKGIYTDDIAEDMLHFLNTAIEYNGKLYVIVEARIGPLFSVREGEGAYKASEVVAPAFDGDLEITVDEVDGNKVTVGFTYRNMYPEGIDDLDLRTSVTLEYEDGKWQIAGGEYIELMEEDNSFAGVEEIRVLSAPQTGFGTVAYAAVAVVAAAGAAIVVKRRRKAV